MQILMLHESIVITGWRAFVAFVTLWRRSLEISPFYPIYRIGIGFLGTLCNLLLLFCHPQLALVDLRSVSGGITLLIGFVKIPLFIT